MLYKTLVEHCSPTLAGMKTANLVSIKTDKEDITAEIRSLNRVLVQKGLRLIPLRNTGNHVLIYLYRPDYLREDLLSPEAACILKEKGYPCGDPDRCVLELIRRLVSEDGFPHEIGLFLGYPPSDVRGFMESPSDGVKCVGCWKVYGNQKEAEKTFAKYKKCKAAYLRAVKKGKPLEHLIVDNRNNRYRQVVNN